MKRIFIVLLTITFVGINVFMPSTKNTEKAHALFNSDDMMFDRGYDCLYYFSDSTPNAEYYAEATRAGIPQTIIDTRYGLTEQELAYLLYSGYFWGFEDDNKNVVVLEFKTMYVSPSLLENLCYCLKQQGCHVMLLTPYYYSSIENCDSIRFVEYDELNRFFKDSVIDMLDDNGQLRNKTSILIDGRFFNLNSLGEDGFDVVAACKDEMTPLLSRLLMYMYYGRTVVRDENGECVDSYYNESIFARELYVDLWDLFKEYYMDEYAYTLNYFEDDVVEMDSYLEMWREIYEERTAANRFLNNYYDDYSEVHQYDFDVLVNTYYATIIKSLYNIKQAHVFAHVTGNTYIDILNLTNESDYDDIIVGGIINEPEPNIYTLTNFNCFQDLFVSTTQYIGQYDYEINYLYAMTIYSMKNEFYQLCFDIQESLDETSLDESFLSFLFRCGIINDFPIYIYAVDPLQTGPNGLRIKTHTQLRAMQNEEDTFLPDYKAEESYYREDDLMDFYQELIEVFFGNP